MAKQAENFVRTEFELEAVFTHAAGGKPTTFRDIVSISATFAPAGMKSRAAKTPLFTKP